MSVIARSRRLSYREGEKMVKKALDSAVHTQNRTSRPI